MSQTWQMIQNAYNSLARLPEQRRPESKELGESMLRIIPALRPIVETADAVVFLSHGTLCFTPRAGSKLVTLVAVNKTEYEVKAYDVNDELIRQKLGNMDDTLIVLRALLSQ